MIKTEIQLFLLAIKNHRQPIAVFILAMIMIIQERNNVKIFPDLGFQWNGLVYYGATPFLFTWLVLRIPFKDSFAGPGDYRFWLPLVIAFSIVALVCALIASQLESFQQYYVEENFHLSEYLLQTGLFMLGWEYFFRGFFLATLKKSFNEGAILIQTIPFVLLHLDKPLLEILMCIPAGLFWGYICYRSRSFWPAFIMHMTMNISLKLLTLGMVT